MMWEMCCSYSASPLGGHYQINDHSSDVTPTKVGRTNTQSLFIFFHVLFFSITHLSIGSPNQSIVWKDECLCVLTCTVLSLNLTVFGWQVMSHLQFPDMSSVCVMHVCRIMHVERPCAVSSVPSQVKLRWAAGARLCPGECKEEEEGCGAGRWLENGKGRDFTYQISVAGYRAGRWSSAAAPGWFLPHAWNVCWDLMRRWRFSWWYNHRLSLGTKDLRTSCKETSLLQLHPSKIF